MKWTSSCFNRNDVIPITIVPNAQLRVPRCTIQFMSFERPPKAPKDEKLTTLGELVRRKAVSVDTDFINTLANAIGAGLASDKDPTKVLRKGAFEKVRDKKRAAFDRMRDEKRAIYAKRNELSADDYRTQINALEERWQKESTQFDAELSDLAED